MNGNAGISQDPANCLRCCIPQLGTAVRQSVQKFHQNLVGCDQMHFSEHLAGAYNPATVLVVGVKERAPIERVCEDGPHSFFGAP
jgi:hypothetical protein